MTDIKVDIILYRTEKPGSIEIAVEIPVSEETKTRLLQEQDKGMTLYEHTALCNLATAIGHLNGMHGFPTRVYEVSQ